MNASITAKPMILSTEKSQELSETKREHALHSGFKILAHPTVIALFLTVLVSGLLVAVLSAIQVNDYSAGTWGVFG